MKLISTISAAFTFSTTSVFAFNFGASAEWNAIANTTIYDDETVNASGFNQVNTVSSGTLTNSVGLGNFGNYSADARAQVTLAGDLRGYTRAEISDNAGPGNLNDFPSRLNVQSLTFVEETWSINSPLPTGSIVPSNINVGWDGTFRISVPGASTFNSSPYFNGIILNVDFSVFEIPSDPFGEPFPVVSYSSGDYIYQADGTVTGGYSSQVFGPQGTTNLILDANNSNPDPLTNQQEISITGTIGFEGEVGKQYRTSVGMFIASNVTGSAGFAEADFLSTGDISLTTIDGDDGSFVSVIPEPSSFILFAGITAFAFVTSRRFSSRLG